MVADTSPAQPLVIDLRVRARRAVPALNLADGEERTYTLTPDDCEIVLDLKGPMEAGAIEFPGEQTTSPEFFIAFLRAMAEAGGCDTRTWPAYPGGVA